MIKKRENILTLSLPQTLFQAFNQKPIKKTIDFRFMEPEMLKCKLILCFDLQKYSEAVFGKHNMAIVYFALTFRGDTKWIRNGSLVLSKSYMLNLQNTVTVTAPSKKQKPPARAKTTWVWRVMLVKVLKNHTQEWKHLTSRTSHNSFLTLLTASGFMGLNECTILKRSFQGTVTNRDPARQSISVIFV